jgi:hypothetical protein
MGLLPIYVAKKDVEFPSEGTYFVVASNGAFVRKDVGYIEGLVPIPFDDLPDSQQMGYCVDTEEGKLYFNKVSAYKKWGEPKIESEKVKRIDLEGTAITEDEEKLWAVEPYITTELPKLPVELAYKALLFFRKVYNKHHGEAVVVIVYNQEKDHYALYCPEQDVSGGGVVYDRKFPKNGFDKDDDPDWVAFAEAGYVEVGTIHSHCNFGAFHSGTDTGDEASFNGVHITFGHVVSKSFSVASSLVLNDYRQRIAPENVVRQIVQIADSGAVQHNHISTNRQDFYELNLDVAALQQQFKKQIQKEWMPKVKVKQWGGYWTGNQRSNRSVYSSNIYAGCGFGDDDDDDGDVQENCSGCGGTGIDPGTRGECTFCEGSGVDENLFTEKTEQDLRDEIWDQEATRDDPDSSDIDLTQD